MKNRARSSLALLLAAFHVASTAALITVAINVELEPRSGRQSTLIAMRQLAIYICGPVREQKSINNGNVE